MTLKPKFWTELPKTPVGKGMYSFFFPARYSRLMENCLNDALVDYKAEVSKWNADEGNKLGSMEKYDAGNPFSAEKQLYRYLKTWQTQGKLEGGISFEEFSKYVAETSEGGALDGIFAPTSVSRPLRLLLKCALNIAEERENGKGAETKVEMLDSRSARVIFTYEGSATPYEDSLKDARPSCMKLIEQFAEFLGGKATVENWGDASSIIIEMPVKRE